MWYLVHRHAESKDVFAALGDVLSFGQSDVFVGDVRAQTQMIVGDVVQFKVRVCVCVSVCVCVCFSLSLYL